MDYSKLENEIGYSFKDKKILTTALTHTSYAYEKKVKSNEKLEFLGDSILEFLSSKYLYNNYKNLKEGEMTKVRATVVCEESLYKIALKHNFSDFLYLGKSEKMKTKIKFVCAVSIRVDLPPSVNTGRSPRTPAPRRR